jgi:hypothetical protein
MSRIAIILPIVFCLTLTSLTSFSQQASIPLNRLWTLECERIALRNDSNEIHLGENRYYLKKLLGRAIFNGLKAIEISKN